MKPFSVLVSASAMVLGIGGGVLAYQSASANAPSGAVVQGQVPAFHSVSRADAGVKIRFAPCDPPAKRVGRACVVDVVKTVVVPTTSTADNEVVPVQGTSPTPSMESDDSSDKERSTPSDESTADPGDDGHEDDDSTETHDSEPDDD